MPLYQYSCRTCGTQEDCFRHVNQRNDSPLHCNTAMERVIVPVAVQMDIPSYISPASGKVINSRKQRHEDFKRTGTRAWEGMAAEKQHAESCKASSDAKFDRIIEQGAAHVLSNMSSEHQRLLTAS